MTFMNRSGGRSPRVLRFYKIAPAQMLVAHDEIDLPPGRRAEDDGGHGGHNGLRDIIAPLGDGNSGACASASAIPATRTGYVASC